MIESTFGNRLRELREAAGLTQKQLAGKAGVALRTVSSLEQALYEPVWSTALALARALGVEVQAFVVPPTYQGGGPAFTAAPQKRGRGRPRKDAPSAAEAPPKKPRGRSSKAE
jgi:transcriptional regulator with XRE-family HTH domain